MPSSVYHVITTTCTFPATKRIHKQSVVIRLYRYIATTIYYVVITASVTRAHTPRAMLAASAQQSCISSIY